MQSMQSLQSFSKFAKNNSLHSFTSHSLAEPSKLASVPGEELLSQGIDGKVRGQEGRANTLGQLFTLQGQAVRGPQGELESQWDAHLDPPGLQDLSTVPSRRAENQETDEGDQYTQGLFLKQLQQQRQQNSQRQPDSHGQDSRVGGHSPPGNPRHEPDQPRTRLPSGVVKTHRDPRTAPDAGAVPSSPVQDQDRADQDSPEQGASKSSTLLSDLQQAVEPAARLKGDRSGILECPHCGLVVSHVVPIGKLLFVQAPLKCATSPIAVLCTTGESNVNLLL